VSHRPTVSVIVPAYNAAGTIGECLESLLALRYPPERLEIQVVDNGSTDGTGSALRAYGDRIAVVGEPTRGAAAARNAGVASSRGEVVAFTDADCVVDPDWLAELVGPLADVRVGIAGGAIRARPGANEVERFGEVLHDHRRAIEVFRPPYAITMNWASRREVLEAVGGFDERFVRCQDVDLSYRVVQAGYRLAFAPGALVYHHNESTLGGLFREGFVHGFHSVRARKRHDDFLRGLGHGRVGRPGYREVGVGLLASLRRREAPCEPVFDCGKKAGKLLGSVRFGYVDL
jgi:GT2 family glycosyltransferase